MHDIIRRLTSSPYAVHCIEQGRGCMTKQLRIIGIVSTAAAFIFCMAGGIYIFVHAGFDKDNILETGIGLYFIGKAFFVGPMLLITIMKK